MALYYGKNRVVPTIKVGATPTGTINITENGNYNVTNYANADVKIYTVPREVDENGVYRTITATTYTLPSEIHDLGEVALLNGFNSCTNLTSVDLSSLTAVTGYCALQQVCKNCTNLTSINLTNIGIINNDGTFYEAFQNCTSLKTLSFPSLNSNSFGFYTNQFEDMLSGVSDCTVHFPSNLQAVIGSWSDVTSGFGGTNTTVLFDLPATT